MDVGDQESIKKGIRTRPPCRFQILRTAWDPAWQRWSLRETDVDDGLEVVLDMGHNFPALEHLFEKVVPLNIRCLPLSSELKNATGRSREIFQDDPCGSWLASHETKTCPSA